MKNRKAGIIFKMAFLALTVIAIMGAYGVGYLQGHIECEYAPNDTIYGASNNSSWQEEYIEHYNGEVKTVCSLCEPSTCSDVDLQQLIDSAENRGEEIIEITYNNRTYGKQPCLQIKEPVCVSTGCDG